MVTLDDVSDIWQRADLQPMEGLLSNLLPPVATLCCKMIDSHEAVEKALRSLLDYPMYGR
ncbi:hypothetical protein K7432_010838 [Basidiobolus ranarum]|uniref:Uncharacterized protein n=1 Tax=Basidiobolus ranarum TaxID=34480 RepID=A0ABR2VUU5_9FUNG